MSGDHSSSEYSQQRKKLEKHIAEHRVEGTFKGTLESNRDQERHLTAFQVSRSESSERLRVSILALDPLHAGNRIEFYFDLHKNAQATGGTYPIPADPGGGPYATAYLGVQIHEVFTHAASGELHIEKHSSGHINGRLRFVTEVFAGVVYTGDFIFAV
ncbi:hypothetical protein [Pseudomonas sp. ADAK13]|uniref:hypothetical protein n=1 Tax=Pseudomonas sp. ADAK13 TaxID=2730847 RepID=UPI001463B7E2|nr:hypothetical protein [Pseudomonas sp. ADAK13]QJI37772.1 hypothetical protein HKK54_26310 [Pseudomonas sp. ADAK13]